MQAHTFMSLPKKLKPSNSLKALVAPLMASNTIHALVQNGVNENEKWVCKRDG
jgi:hypothetical protein